MRAVGILYSLCASSRINWQLGVRNQNLRTMRKITLLSLLTVLLAWAMTDAVAQNLVVSGATDASFNGTYVPSGTANSKTPYLFAANNKAMFYDFGR